MTVKAAKGKGKGKGPGGVGGTGGKGGRGKGGANNKKNKPCTCSKKPSKANQDKANAKKGRQKARCRSCGKTGAQSAAERIIGLKQEGHSVKNLSRKIKYWQTKGSKICSDHKYPASGIKKLPGFGKLEAQNPDAARRVMTAQHNMQKLCMVCNRKKWAGGNFSSAKLEEMIQGYLK